MATAEAAKIATAADGKNKSTVQQFIDDVRALAAASHASYRSQDPKYDDVSSGFIPGRTISELFDSMQYHDGGVRGAIVSHFWKRLLDNGKLEVEVLKEEWETDLDEIPGARQVADGPAFPGILNYLLECNMFVVIDDAITIVPHLREVEESALLDMEDCMQYLLSQYPEQSATPDPEEDELSSGESSEKMGGGKDASSSSVASSSSSLASSSGDCGKPAAAAEKKKGKKGKAAAEVQSSAAKTAKEPPPPATKKGKAAATVPPADGKRKGSPPIENGSVAKAKGAKVGQPPGKPESPGDDVFYLPEGPHRASLPPADSPWTNAHALRVLQAMTTDAETLTAHFTALLGKNPRGTESKRISTYLDLVLVFSTSVARLHLSVSSGNDPEHMLRLARENVDHLAAVRQHGKVVNFGKYRVVSREEEKEVFPGKTKHGPEGSGKKREEIEMGDKLKSLCVPDHWDSSMDETDPANPPITKELVLQALDAALSEVSEVRKQYTSATKRRSLSSEVLSRIEQRLEVFRGLEACVVEGKADLLTGTHDPVTVVKKANVFLGRLAKLGVDIGEVFEKFVSWEEEDKVDSGAEKTNGPIGDEANGPRLVIPATGGIKTEVIDAGNISEDKSASGKQSTEVPRPVDESGNKPDAVSETEAILQNGVEVIITEEVKSTQACQTEPGHTALPLDVQSQTDTLDGGCQTESRTTIDGGCQTDYRMTCEGGSQTEGTADGSKSDAAAGYLETKLLGVEEEKKELAKRLRNAEDIVTMLLDARRHLDGDIQRLTSERDLLTRDKEQLSRDNQQLKEQDGDKDRDEAAKMEASLEELRQEKASLIAKTSEMTKAYDDLEQKNDRLAEKFDKLSQENKALAEARDKAVKDKAAACSERDRLSKEAAVAAREKEALVRIRGELMRENKGLSEQCEQLQEENDCLNYSHLRTKPAAPAPDKDLAQKVQVLAQEKAKLAERVYELTQEKELLAEEKDLLEKKHQKLSADRDKVAASRDLLSKKNSQLTSERDKLSKTRDKLSGERDGLSADKDKLTVERNRAVKEKDKTGRERDRLAEERGRIEEEKKELEAEKARVEQERDQLSARVDDLVQRTEVLRMEMTIVCRERENLVRILNGLRQEKTDLAVKCEHLLEGREGGTVMQDKENNALRTRVQYFQRLHDEKSAEVSAFKKEYFTAMMNLALAQSDICSGTYSEALNQLSAGISNTLLDSAKKEALCKLRDRLREKRETAALRNAKLVEMYALLVESYDDADLNVDMPKIQEAEIPDEVHAALFDIAENYQGDPSEETVPFETVYMQKLSKKPVQNGTAAASSPVHVKPAKFAPSSPAPKQPPPPAGHPPPLKIQPFESIPLPPNHPHTFRPPPPLMPYPPHFPPQQYPNMGWGHNPHPHPPPQFYRPPMPHHFHARPPNPRPEGFRPPYPHDRNHPNFINDLLGYTDSVAAQRSNPDPGQRPSQSQNGVKMEPNQQAAKPKLQPVITDYPQQPSTSATVSVKSQTTFNRLMAFLAKKFPDNTVEELQESVKTLREENNNTLQGMTMDAIMSLIAQVLQRKAKSKKPAWGAVDDKEWTNPMEDMECAICIELISKDSQTTLQCNHVFHTMCIKTWLGMNSICPKCMRHVVMADEFPPLK